MASTSEKRSEEPISPTFAERVKHALWPDSGPREHKVEEHEGRAEEKETTGWTATTSGTAATTKTASVESPFQVASARPAGRQVEAERLKPEEADVGMVRPKFSGSIEPGSQVPAHSGAELAPTPKRQNGGPPAFGSPHTTPASGTAGASSAPPTPGQRTEALPAGAERGLPGLDTAGEAGPVSPVEAAELKAKEHALRAEQQRRRVEAKQAELKGLRQRAAALEQQSAALVAEAELERRRVEQAVQEKETIEEEEAGEYAKAERAEVARREAVQRAKPPARAAAAKEDEVLQLKQDASDAEFHAQVLENRAKALVAESREMAELSLDKGLEAQNVAAQLLIARQEVDDMKQQINQHPARGLPQYTLECQREIGALSHRIAQLREEIAWAETEMEHAREESDSWRRMVVAKEGQAAHLLLRLTQLQEDADLARQRSRNAAQEATTPVDLADQKYHEAEEFKLRYQQLEAALLEAQHEVLEVAKEAVGPNQERQVHLREAAKAEQAAKAVEEQVEIGKGKVQSRLYEAEVKAETAQHTTEKAEVVQRQVGAVKEEVAAEERMQGTFEAQKEAHAHRSDQK